MSETPINRDYALDISPFLENEAERSIPALQMKFNERIRYQLKRLQDELSQNSLLTPDRELVEIKDDSEIEQLRQAYNLRLRQQISQLQFERNRFVSRKSEEIL